MAIVTRYRAYAYVLLPYIHRKNNKKARQRETTRTTMVKRKSLRMRYRRRQQHYKKMGEKSVAQLRQASWEVGISHGPPKRGGKSHNTYVHIHTVYFIYIHLYGRCMYLKQQKQKKRHLTGCCIFVCTLRHEQFLPLLFSHALLSFSYSTIANLAYMSIGIFFICPPFIPFFLKNLGCCFLSFSFCFW